MRRIATIDCETDPFEERTCDSDFTDIAPFIWDVFDGEEHHTFNDTAHVIAFLYDKDWIVYAHNGGKFDYHQPGFLDELDAYDSISIINGRLAKFTIGACEFRDSVNILPIALADYQKTEIDYAKMRKKVRAQHMKEIRAYLRDDTEFLYQIVKAFIDEYGLRLTLAGSAMHVWKGMHGTVPNDKDGTQYHRITPFYYGGRVEAFSQGITKGDIHVYDINSAYPYAMLSAHPYSLIPDVSGFDGTIRGDGFYIVEGISLGALPFRADKLRFPCDNIKRQYTVSGWELQAAIDTGAIEDYEILQQIIYGSCVSFSEYVDRFYEIKKKAKKGSPEYLLAKLHMNSLYGKFASNPENYKEYMLVPYENIAHECERMENDNGWTAGEDFDISGIIGKWAVFSFPVPESKQRYYHLGTGASITGFVRGFLWRHIHACRQQGITVLYCDTDSIVTNRDASGLFKMGGDLGQWDCEFKGDMAAIAGKKMYAIRGTGEYAGKWKIGSKGAKLTVSEIVRVAQGETVRWHSNAPTYKLTKVAQWEKGAKSTLTYLNRDIRSTV